MFEKVLFPTDLSEYALKTLDCIGEIPGVKEVILLHIVDAPPSKHGWIYGPKVEDAKIRLNEQAKNLENLGLKVKTKVDVIYTGHVSQTILDEAENENPSLIVINARGKSLVKGLLLGSVALEVIRHAKTDILIMRYKLVESLENKKLQKFCDKLFSKVLCPTDFSEDIPAMVKNIGINEIILAHVVTKGETLEEIESNVEEAKTKVLEIKKNLVDAGFKVKEHIRVGSPAEEICLLAEEEDVSLISISSLGKGWVKELLLGDTAYDIIKRAKRPVLVSRVKVNIG